MKEATGELNMTVIAIVAIAAIGAFFYAVIWPKVKNNIETSTKCANAVCSNCTTNNTTGIRTCTQCYAPDGSGNAFDCSFKDKDVTPQEP